jgi:hypothetical protein
MPCTALFISLCVQSGSCKPADCMPKVTFMLPYKIQNQTERAKQEKIPRISPTSLVGHSVIWMLKKLLTDINWICSRSFMRANYRNNFKEWCYVIFFQLNTVWSLIGVSWCGRSRRILEDNIKVNLRVIQRIKASSNCYPLNVTRRMDPRGCTHALGIMWKKHWDWAWGFSDVKETLCKKML